MLYFDTSFLAPLLLEEAASGRVERFFARLKPGEMAVSRWTLVEFSSLLAREARMGGLDESTALEVDAEFLRMIDNSFVVLPVGADDFELARRYVQTYSASLRVGDALHLAIAGNHGARAIYSLDKRFVGAGKQLGLPASHGIRLSG